MKNRSRRQNPDKIKFSWTRTRNNKRLGMDKTDFSFSLFYVLNAIVVSNVEIFKYEASNSISVPRKKLIRVENQKQDYRGKQYQQRIKF